MKQKITVNSKDSGINITRICAKIFKIIGIISFVLCGLLFLSFMVHDFDEEIGFQSLMFLFCGYANIVLYAIFQVLHSVATNALFKRAIMEQEYDFNMLEDKEQEDNEDKVNSL